MSAASFAIDKYLRLYAEPEARDARALACLGERQYFAVLVVPAFGEAAALLDGYRAAALAAPGRVLVVLVVNASAASDPGLVRVNAELLQRLAHSAHSEPFFLREEGEFDLLVVDRTSPERRLPAKQGVGLARKLGADLALRLFSLARVQSSWLYSTDADARLPSDYFLRAASSHARSALLFPFAHVPSGESEVDRATLAYECSLRYHVLGLAAAGSPYAFHSLGSALAVRADAYAAVRGVPKRTAGEDFYLLDKLCKLDPLERLAGAPVELLSRRSLRVPFGTGPRVDKLLTEGELRVASPRAYAALAAVLQSIAAFCREPSVQTFDLTLHPLTKLERAIAAEALAASGLREAALEARGRVAAEGLARRLHSWFDALRTLRFLHELRDRGLAELPLATALAQAPFAAPLPAAAPLPLCVETLRALESALPSQIGPSLVSWG